MSQLSRRSVLLGTLTCCTSLLAGCVDDFTFGLSEDEERALQHYQDGVERNEFAREYFANAVEEFEEARYDAAFEDFSNAYDLFSSSAEEFDEIVSFYSKKLDNQEIGEIASEASEASKNGKSAASINDSINFYLIGMITEENLVENFQTRTEQYNNEEVSTPPVSEFKNTF